MRRPSEDWWYIVPTCIALAMDIAIVVLILLLAAHIIG